MNTLKRARLRAEAFRENVAKKRARFRADCARLGRGPKRGSHSLRNGCWPGKYGRWGRMSAKQKKRAATLLSVRQRMADIDEYESAEMWWLLSFR